jgi:hypothetical protein
VQAHSRGSGLPCDGTGGSDQQSLMPCFRLSTVGASDSFSRTPPPTFAKNPPAGRFEGGDF